MAKKFTMLYLIIVLPGLLFILISTSVIASSDCSSLKGCKKKFCDIDVQLKIAQEKGSKHKADGLKQALENSKENCTDKALREDLIEAIEDTNNEIKKYESDLNEAKEYGKTDKIRKYQEKIKEEKSKRNYLEGELSNLN